MPRVHYNEEMKPQMVKLVLKGEKSTSRESRPLQACLQKVMTEAQDFLEKSATKIAKDIGVTANTVCRWVQDYRRQNNLPSYEEERRLKRVSIEELATKNRELERKLKQREKELAEEKSASRIS